MFKVTMDLKRKVDFVLEIKDKNSMKQLFCYISDLKVKFVNLLQTK